MTNAVVAPPGPPNQNKPWLLGLEATMSMPTLPKTEAECKTLKMDSTIWGERNGVWTQLRDDHTEGSWYATGNGPIDFRCSAPNGSHLLPLALKGTPNAFDRYRVLATAHQTTPGGVVHHPVEVRAAQVIF